MKSGGSINVRRGELKVIRVYKAEYLNKDISSNDLYLIAFDKPQPTFKTLGDQRQDFTKQAKEIVDAFYNSVPGGLFDQVAAEFLNRIASDLKVSHGGG